jgi:hypothetical protein
LCIDAAYCSVTVVEPHADVIHAARSFFNYHDTGVTSTTNTSTNTSTTNTSITNTSITNTSTTTTHRCLSVTLPGDLADPLLTTAATDGLSYLRAVAARRATFDIIM